MDSADEDIARLDSKVTSARDSLPGAYGHTIRVFRPSPWRIVPCIVACLAATPVVFVSDAPPALRVLAALSLLPAVYLTLELLLHRVVVTATTVTDRTWRRSSTTDGSRESITVLDLPDGLSSIWSRRRRPTMIVWTALDGRQHQLPFLWFRRNEVPSIIGAVQRL